MNVKMAFPVGIKAAILFYLLVISSIGNSSTDDHTNDDGRNIDLRLIRQEIGLLREENQKQYTEILTLKETVNLQNNTITQHELIIEELGQKIKNSLNCYKNRNDSSEKQKRNKRPARLLPLQLLFDRDDDDDTTKKPPPRKFYGPPTNFSDLARLGYTLNGYYLVQHNITETTIQYSHYSSNSNATETVYCAFKQEGTFNSSLVEQKLKLLPPLNNNVIEELNQIFSKNGHLGESNLTNSTEKRKDEDIIELKKEMAQLRRFVKDFQSSESYNGTPFTNTVICFAVQKLAAIFNSSQLEVPSVVKFEEEVLNLGESFHLKESVFIAPNDGVYEFIFSGHKRGNNKEPVLKVSLRLNGKVVSSSLAEELTGEDPPMNSEGPSPVHNYRCPISMHSLLELKKGDRIDVFKSQGTLHDHDIHFPIHFSGKLLFNGDVKNHNPKKLPDAVYFFLQKRTGFNTSNSIIPFEVEGLNVGGAFNTKKNAFTAPISGIYEFNLRGYKTLKKQNTFISLRLNGNTMASSLSERIDFHDHHTPIYINSILRLKQNDVVYLHLITGQIYDDDNQYTIFAGKLLSIDNGLPRKRINNTNVIPSSLAVFFYVQRKNLFDRGFKVLPFENTILNVGEAFNLSENTFIAPIGGIYEFSFVGMRYTFALQMLSIALRLNGIPVTYATADFAERHQFRNPIYLHSIVKIKIGDHVDIYLEYGGVFSDGTEPFIHFTGKLLFAIDSK